MDGDAVVNPLGSRHVLTGLPMLASTQYRLSIRIIIVLKCFVLEESAESFEIRWASLKHTSHSAYSYLPSLTITSMTYL